MGDSREYPSVRKALLGQSENGVANLWCGVKWCFWQLCYVAAAILLAGLGLLLLPIFILDKVFSGPRSEAAASWAKDTVRGIATHDYTYYAGRTLLVGSFIGSTVGLVYALEKYPDATLELLGFIFALILIMVLVHLTMTFGVEPLVGWLLRNKPAVTERTKDRAIVRRFVGYCPVSMNIEPKWFSKIFEP